VDSLVEALAEARADRREVLDLVKELCASFIEVANGSHRW